MNIAFRIGRLSFAASGVFSPQVELQVRSVSRQAIQEGWLTARVVACDKSLIKARGPIWHKKQRKRKQIPKKLRGIDRESKWGVSPYHGWVQGYAAHLVVNATPGEVLFPLVIQGTTANVNELDVFASHILYLPEATRKCLIDLGYDDDWTFRKLLHRHVMPIIPIHTCASSSEIRKQVRQAYRRQLNRKLYKRRMSTIERSFARKKHLFETNGQTWFYGARQNRTFLAMAAFAIQLLTLYNLRHGRPAECIKVILDSL